MRIQMVRGRQEPLPGGGVQSYQPGRIYVVDDATAAEWMAAGDAVDPAAPPAPDTEPSAGPEAEAGPGAEGSGGPGRRRNRTQREG